MVARARQLQQSSSSPMPFGYKGEGTLVQAGRLLSAALRQDMGLAAAAK